VWFLLYSAVPRCEEEPIIRCRIYVPNTKESLDCLTASYFSKFLYTIYLVSVSVLSEIYSSHIPQNFDEGISSVCHHSLRHSFVESRRFGGHQGLRWPGYETVQSAQFTASVDGQSLLM